MAGEADQEHPLSLPVSPFGALVIELRPFDAGFLPLALRIPLSRGAPVLTGPDSRLSAALWPGGVLEIELLPERLPAPPRFIAQTGGMRLCWQDGSPPLLRCESAALVREYPLPDGALTPGLLPAANALFLTGERSCGDQYALVLAPDASSLLLSVTGKDITPVSGGAALRLTHPFGDSMGHAALETWAPTPAGWQITASEPLWEHGAPIRPLTPEATAVAALEAAQLGLIQEAAAFCAPAVPHADILRRAAEFDGCVPLRYALPSGQSAVGLLKLRDHFLHVTPVLYAAQPGGMYGGCLLTRLEIGENVQM